MHIERNFSFTSLTTLIYPIPSFHRLPKWQIMPSFRKFVIFCLLCLPWFLSPHDWVYFRSGEYANLLFRQSRPFFCFWISFQIFSERFKESGEKDSRNGFGFFFQKYCTLSSSFLQDSERRVCLTGILRPQKAVCHSGVQSRIWIRNS